MEFMPLNVRITIQISFKITDPALKTGSCDGWFSFPQKWAQPLSVLWPPPSLPCMNWPTWNWVFRGSPLNFGGFGLSLAATIITTCTTPTLHHNQHGQHNATSPQGDSRTRTRTGGMGHQLCHPSKNVCLLFKNYSTHSWPTYQPWKQAHSARFRDSDILWLPQPSLQPRPPPPPPPPKWAFMLVSGFRLPESACHHHLPTPIATLSEVRSGSGPGIFCRPWTWTSRSGPLKPDLDPVRLRPGPGGPVQVRSRFGPFTVDLIYLIIS